MGTNQLCESDPVCVTHHFVQGMKNSSEINRLLVGSPDPYI